ncbi:MAG: glycosyltransferase family 4 protein, partial [Candidatus Nealsonbacteria bacterium]|nr:glycosyltransferase family 4 protein [Candidatus Nealsonbacteria bacterium]
PTFKKSIRNLPDSHDAKMRDSLKFIGVGKILKILKDLDVDVIHNHLGWRLLPFIDILKSPVVTTLHGPLDVKYQQKVYGEFKNCHFVSISNNQRKPLPGLNYAGTVYNGIETEKFPFKDKIGDYLAFLGRMSPEKGPLQAIEVAKKTGLKLKMAAKIDAVDKEFFESMVRPLIDNKQIEFLGEINHETKAEFLKNALVLLAPIQWEEPFGLYFVEAMACGTPVISFNRGSVPEIVENGKTGFIVNSTKEMADVIKNIDEIKRSDCREHVEKYFSVKKMTEGYTDIYNKII